MKYLIAFAIVIFVFVKINSSQKIPSKLCPLKEDSIVVLGDSLANGYGVGERESFALKIPITLNKKPSKMGIDGETTIGLLNRMDLALDSIPSIAAIIISIGGNDFLRKIERSQTLSNLESIILKAKKRTNCVILLGVPSSIYSNGVDSMYINLAKKYKLILDSISMPLIFKNRDLRVDAIHPNENGHSLIAKNMLDLINQYK